MCFATLKGQRIRSRLYIKHEGYLIVRHFIQNVDRNNVSALRKIVRAQARPIFQHTADPNKKKDVDKNDNKRLQHCMPYKDQPLFLKNITKATNELMRELYPKIKFYQSNASLLLSLAGCMAQDLHYDYPPLHEASETSFGCIVFLEDGGKLLLGRGNKILRPQFNKGDLVIFKGTKLHAGAAYRKSNLRVHYYFDSQKNFRKPDTTFTRFANEAQRRAKLAIDQLKKIHVLRKRSRLDDCTARLHNQ